MKYFVSVTAFLVRRFLTLVAGWYLGESMARLGASVTAVDASPMAIEVAKKHASLDPVLNGRLEYIHGSVEGSQLPTTFDVVTCMEVLEHVEQPRDFYFH